MARNKPKLIQGWGVNDVHHKVSTSEVINGKIKVVWRCPYYMDWKRILASCYAVEFHNNRPTYKNCTISEEWKYLSNFIKWVDSQPNKNWVNCEPDKDILFEGNKHYSPETVAYIPSSLNVFITSSFKARGEYMLGVTFEADSKINPYKARCSNPFTKKGEYLGLFSTELEAHKAWQAKKHEHACKFADLQEDIRVADALRQRYSPDKDWTNK